MEDTTGEILNRDLDAIQNRIRALQIQLAVLQQTETDLLEIMQSRGIVRKEQSSGSLPMGQTKSHKAQLVDALFKMVPELIRNSSEGRVKMSEIIQAVEIAGIITGKNINQRTASAMHAGVQHTHCPFEAVPEKKGFYRMKKA